MWSLFGKKENSAREGEKTVLILDIEHGSAGSALVRLSPGQQPKMFGETRVLTPVPFIRSGSALAQDAEKALSLALQNAAEVAARVRNHASASMLGRVDSVAAFLAPPWGTPNLGEGKPHFMDSMAEYVRRAVASSFGDIPLSFYTSAGAAAFGTKALMTDEPCLVCSVTGELSEILRLDESGVQAHATVPVGFHGLLRTLRTHGGVSEAEARSAVRIAHLPHLQEPAAAAAAEFSAHFKDAAGALMRGGELTRIILVAPEHLSEWFARALTNSPDGEGSLAELFPSGEVRALRAHHATAHIAAHADTPDLHLLLDTLFVDSYFNK